jgi:hypothetical protein
MYMHIVAGGDSCSIRYFFGVVTSRIFQQALQDRRSRLSWAHLSQPAVPNSDDLDSSMSGDTKPTLGVEDFTRADIVDDIRSGVDPWHPNCPQF